MKNARLETLLTEFETRYGRRAEVGARAPGRVDLMGSHTDYNEGYVLTLPIDRDIWIVAAPNSDTAIRVRSLNMDGEAEFSAADPLQGMTPGWDAYVRGVVHVLRDSGRDVGGFDAVIHGTVPIGSGLSSSASLECATAVLLAELGGFEIDRVETARLCQRAENEVVGVNCGILDQYTSMLGEEDRALVLDCRHLTHEQAGIPDGLGVVICDTRAPRQLTGSEYGERRAQCEQGAEILSKLVPGARTLRDFSVAAFDAGQERLETTVRKRCRFIVEENQRVLDLAAALRADDREALSGTTAASFAGARDLFEISVPAMEAMFEAMRSAPGVSGARQAGAGFGGCMVAFVASGMVEAFCESVSRAYEEKTGIAPELYPVRPVAGANPMGVA